MSELNTRNTRRGDALVAGVIVLYTVIGVVVGVLVGQLVVGLVVGLVVSAVLVARGRSTADAVALRASNAHVADAQQYQRLHNLVEGLCIANGLPKPAVYVVDDPAPNAFSVGRDAKHASIAVTTGLLEGLDRVELEGVVAHELAHIRNNDIAVATLAVTFVGYLSLGIAPLRARLTASLVAPEQHTLADVAGCQMTRFPPGLISALEKLQATSSVVRASSAATAHLWIVQPVAGASDTHPVLDERIALLREL